jgi:AcrR family transcriptional regulator
MAKRAQREEESRLQTSDWEDAALSAIAEHGLDGLAVEPLARRLGVTKGSFYWHFENRDALLAATLERWEQRGTEQIITALERIDGPRARLERLFLDAMTPSGGALYRALSASAHPLIAPVMARVAARRLEFVASCYRQLGYPKARAQHAALLAVAAYLGLLQLALDAPKELPRDTRTYVRHVIETLLPPIKD